MILTAPSDCSKKESFRCIRGACGMSRIDETRAFVPVNIAILTVSDTRTLANDTSGDALATMIGEAGHTVFTREIIKDDADALEATFRGWIANPEIDVIISSGGTGVTGRDVTPEALDRVLEKKIEGFGELFRMLSYQKIGTSTIQSRALAGVANGTYIFALPGSTGAVKDAWQDILRWQLDIRHRPCNFVELMPRLKER
ncbi:Molybdenum cofactor biosynthesis protein B [Granulibacter bethesdensis]|nr:Molybdenum cofactor biosynthesis protein B [Granulibacter bethesdensis]